MTTKTQEHTQHASHFVPTYDDAILNKRATEVLDIWTFNHRNRQQSLDKLPYTGTANEFIQDIEKHYEQVMLIGEWQLCISDENRIGGYQYLIINTIHATYILMHSYVDFLKFRAEMPQSFQ